MKRLLGAAFLLCSSLLAQAPGDSSSSTISAAHITVPLTAIDDRGNPVLDLSKDHLTVSDNGHIIDATELRKTADLPLDLGIILRASNSNFPQQQVAAIDLLQKAFHTDMDRSFVITAGGNQPWPTTELRWQSEPNALAKSVQGLDRCTGLWDPFEIHFDSSRNCPGNEARTDVPDGVFGVLLKMFESDPRAARRVVVLFREPWGHSSLGPASADAHRDNRLGRVTSMAQRLGVLFYVIGVQDPSVGPVGFEDRPHIPSATNIADERRNEVYEKRYATGRSNIERMSEETGGRVWWSTKKNYPDAVAGIIKALNAEYALTFLVNGSKATAETHRLKVTASRSDAHIFAPKAYFVLAQ